MTTKVATDFISKAPANIMATITPQHLLYTVGDLVQGLKYHLFCLPLLKFDEDREALRKAVSDPKNTKFFAGTDSAPHATKVTECGCAAGCYTGGIAPQLYALAFELAGVDLDSAAGVEIFTRFLCSNGPGFYGLKTPGKTFTLERTPQTISPLKISDGKSITRMPTGIDGTTQISWKVAV